MLYQVLLNFAINNHSSNRLILRLILTNENLYQGRLIQVSKTNEMSPLNDQKTLLLTSDHFQLLKCCTQRECHIHIIHKNFADDQVAAILQNGAYKRL